MYCERSLNAIVLFCSPIFLSHFSCRASVCWLKSVFSYSFLACNISTSAQIAFKLPAGVEINGQTSSHSSSTDTCNTDGEGVFERLLKSKRISVWPFFHPNERIVVAASLNGGNVIERFIKMLRVWCRQLGCPAIETAQVSLHSCSLLSSPLTLIQWISRYTPYCASH